MKFGPDEYVSKCERQDCVIEDQGGSMTLQQAVQTYDKHGNPLPAQRTTTYLHRRCRTCGESWAVEA